MERLVSQFDQDSMTPENLDALDRLSALAHCPSDRVGYAREMSGEFTCVSYRIRQGINMISRLNGEEKVSCDVVLERSIDLADDSNTSIILEVCPSSGYGHGYSEKLYSAEYFPMGGNGNVLAVAGQQQLPLSERITMLDTILSSVELGLKDGKTEVLGFAFDGQRSDTQDLRENDRLLDLAYRRSFMYEDELKAQIVSK